MSNSILSEIQKLAPSAQITLFFFDLTPGQSITENQYYFHTGTNGLNQPITFGGQVYQPWPIEVSGYDKAAGGAMPRVTVKLSNINLLFTTLCINFNDMLGAQLTRIRTFARFIDAVNFPSGINSDADPTQTLIQDVHYLEQKSSESPTMVELVFAAKIDVEGVKLPQRQVTYNMCAWGYRSGVGCSYAGPPVQDILGNNLADEYSTASYNPGDNVSVAGVNYTCILACQGISPPNATYWASIAAYSNTSLYAVGNLVSYLGSDYICIVGVEGTPPTDSTYWTPTATFTPYNNDLYGPGEIIVDNALYYVCALASQNQATTNTTYWTRFILTPLDAPYDNYNPATAYTPGDVVIFNNDSTQVFVNIVGCTGISPEPGLSTVNWFCDACAKQLSSCQARPWAGNVLPFGAFPGVSNVPATTSGY